MINSIPCSSVSHKHLFVPINKLTACITLIFSSLSLNLFAEHSSPSKEEYLQAALIYKMANYLKWDKELTSVTYCFLGTQSHVLGNILLKKQVQNKVADNITIINKNAYNKQISDDCNIVFASNSFKLKKQSIQQLLSKSVFTITDSNKLLSKGFIASIEFRKSKPQINVKKDNLKRSGVSVHSRLLAYINLM